MIGSCRCSNIARRDPTCVRCTATGCCNVLWAGFPSCGRHPEQEDELSLEPAQDHGQPRHVRHHRPGSLVGGPRYSSFARKVFRLVTVTPQRLSLAALAALCDILDVGVESSSRTSRPTRKWRRMPVVLRPQHHRSPVRAPSSAGPKCCDTPRLATPDIAPRRSLL